MNEITILMTLATVHFIALMSPGPDFALVVQNATRFGRQTGFYIALGLSFGILLHSILSLTGVSYVVHQHPTLFAMVQIAGGSYLLYLGIGALRSVVSRWGLRHQPAELANDPSLLLSSRRQAFSRGFTTNILNPKALVFFISLMSTLVPSSMSVPGKLIALAILWSLSLAWFSFLAWALSTKGMQRKLGSASIYIDALCGLLFSGIGLTILLQVLLSL
ncbi:LysE family translocator [Vibrio mediterranei]|uniref:LysE family translocator n=1 Tax=Vibrio mediterranei TaxID=689 RepID=A0A3G4VCP0_9VIBR|nr:LysE family translocator [Vibrio mediterranei]AYV21342.1 LysE family translocator [Vibrio mediterranei]NUW73962.1 LysE family translocator [Vibrio mediterranei]